MRTLTRWSDLVRAIQAAPDDDAPRVVAADWLLERGDPRGEHVALQVELARAGASASEIALRLAAIDPSPWLAPLVELGARGTRGPLVLERGFVDHAELTGKDVANVGPLLRREPITRLTLASGGDGPSLLAAEAPELARLRALRLGGQFVHSHSLIIRSPHLAELAELDVSELLEPQLAGLADTVLRPRAIVISPRWTSMRVLAPSRLFERLESFEARALASDASLVELATAPLASLRRLHIMGWQVGPRGLHALGDRLGQLDYLRYPAAALDAAALALIVRHASGLRVLELDGCRLDLDATLDSGVLDHLARLDVTSSLHSPAAMARFQARTRGRVVVKL